MYNNTRVLISYKKVKDLDNIPGPHKGEVPEYWVFVTLWALGLGLLMLEILLRSAPNREAVATIIYVFSMTRPGRESDTSSTGKADAATAPYL